MRYTEPKERSAELLRVALGLMGRQEAAFNPITFTLWYEYAAGINPRLHAALDQLLQHDSPIGDEAVAKLYHDHIAPHDETAMRRISGEFQQVMQGIALTASHTGEQAGLFGAKLDDLSAALLASDSGGGTLTPHLSEALAGTAEMKNSADALQQQVAAGQTEIARLRTDLDRARGEAMLDPLTAILNRKGFDLRVEKLLTQAPLEGKQHCLIMFDIDHFKKVNDTHGHVMGDRVLQGLGAILRHAATEQACSAARYGGEEFAIVVPDCTLVEATRLAEQVRAHAKAMKVKNRSTQEVLFSITISGGVTAWKPEDDAASFVARADSALYRSKNGGRDCVTCA